MLPSLGEQERERGRESVIELNLSCFLVCIARRPSILGC